MVCLVCTVML